MNVPLANKLEEKVNQVYQLILEIDANIPQIAPDTHSVIESKGNIVGLLQRVALLKEDIARFRDGKALPNTKKLAEKAFDELSQKIADKKLPPDGFGF